MSVVLQSEVQVEGRIILLLAFMHIKIEGVICINLQVNFDLKLRTLKVHGIHTWMIEWRLITWFNNANCEVFRVEDEDLNMMDYEDVGK